MQTLSFLQEQRVNYHPLLPTALKSFLSLIPKHHTQIQTSLLDSSLQTVFPNTHSNPILTFENGNNQEKVKLKIGVVLSGGQAPGGHTVIAGLFDAAREFHPHSEIIGFKNGPSGIVKNSYILLDAETIQLHRNQGGFDLLGSGRTKIETPEQLEAACKTAKEHDLDGLVIIGGDDSNTNAAFLAEYFAKKGLKTTVCGVPKTIDGDLKNEFIDLSFGFDTASKVYSEIIGNLLRDAKSSTKYYFFIKIMGRSASHLALECALQTHPNLTLISEEIEKENQNLSDVVDQIVAVICRRSDQGKDYGGILIPEGIIEFIPDCKQLVNELNILMKGNQPTQLLENMTDEQRLNYLRTLLSFESFACLIQFPFELQRQLLLDRDPHGNVQVSKIETERLLISLVEKKLKILRKQEKYKGKFSPQPFFCGYEGRSALPTNFDCNYCYSLGVLATLMIRWKLNGYMACIQQLANEPENWDLAAVPLSQMIHQELREGKARFVIKKSLVQLNQPSFLIFCSQREHWILQDNYINPGPIQFFGSKEVSEKPPLSLIYDRKLDLASIM